MKKVCEFVPGDDLKKELEEVLMQVKNVKRSMLTVTEKYEKKNPDAFENLAEGLELMDDIIDIISNELDED